MSGGIDGVSNTRQTQKLTKEKLQNDYLRIKDPDEDVKRVFGDKSKHGCRCAVTNIM